MRAMPTLDELRTQLGQIDRDMLELVQRRQALAIQIGQAKRATGLPVRDYRQERDVVQRARQAAAERGLSPNLGEELVLMLIRYSLTVQEKDLVSTAGSGGGRRVLVIGGRGNIGHWFVRFLTAQGYSCVVADPAGPVDGVPYVADWRQVPLDHDLIVVAAPMPASNDILLELAKSPPRGVVFDVGSLKSPLREGLHALRDAGGKVTSIHPMFGPDTELLSGRHVIFIDLGVPEATAAARELFATTMATLGDMDLESHDRLIAYVLGLSLALNIACFSALAVSGVAAPSLARLWATTFDAQLGVAG
jgi:chorismate mutase/prephenate dehydrogenase